MSSSSTRPSNRSISGGAGMEGDGNHGGGRVMVLAGGNRLEHHFSWHGYSGEADVTTRKNAPRVDLVSTRSRIDKLGVKGGAAVLVLGVEGDCTFMDELRARGARVRTGGNKAMDMIFALFRHRDDLRRLPSLVARLKADGVLWTLRPKGSDDLKESEMRRAGQDAGLVDVKVVAFSDVLTAEKFVIPVANRAAHRSSGARPTG